MMPEQKEIAIWAGGAAVLVIVGWIVLAMRGGAIEETGAAADAAHAKYEAAYLDTAGERKPAAEAIAILTERRDVQADELAAVEEQLVWPGSGQGVPPEFAGVLFGPVEVGITTDYNTALDMISRVTTRLRRRGESLGIQVPAELPLEASGELSNDDDALRNLQLAQACAYAALTDLAMDAVVTRVGPIEIGPAWTDPTASYAFVTATTVLECSYESADAMLRQLGRNTWGLGVERAVLDFQDDGSFRLTLGVRLVVPNDSAWELKNEPQAVGQAAGGVRGGARGGARRGAR